MQDGYTQVGAGDSDMRVAGKDLQHNRQTRTADELHVPVRRFKKSIEDGGPMKKQMAIQLEDNVKNHLQHELAQEMHRHKEAQKHFANHIERHHKRHHDSQYGQDNYNYYGM